MAKSIKVNQKKRGRPATGRDPVSAVRLPTELTAAVDKWAEDHEANRSEAIRRLVEIGLTAKTRSAPSERQRATLADLASKAIDSLTVSEPNNGEKASRKRRLIKWHEEMREARVDLPKAKK
jgi:metal-responsive CopG/Arc/MetJ family transcriptional regulator